MARLVLEVRSGAVVVAGKRANLTEMKLSDRCAPAIADFVEDLQRLAFTFAGAVNIPGLQARQRDRRKGPCKFLTIGRRRRRY